MKDDIFNQLGSLPDDILDDRGEMEYDVLLDVLGNVPGNARGAQEAYAGQNTDEINEIIRDPRLGVEQPIPDVPLTDDHRSVNGNSDYVHQRVTVPTSGILVLALNEKRKALIIQNLDAANFIDYSMEGKGSIDKGLRLVAGAVITFTFRDCPRGELYIRADTGAVIVAIGESIY